ncbi:MAG TPA: GNAT family N-acetyltransferase [Longimicrobium sp.]|nr:GNAT family N-acetyltransferase [Longimicrobium sp.]
MLPASPRLETERLVLRLPALEDFDRWAEMMADENAARFIGGVARKPATWRSMMLMAGAWALTGVAMFSVIEKASGLWIGRIGPWQPYGWPGPEIGYGLHPDAWGKGYAVEAAAATMDYAFDVLGWADVIHCINPQNTASRRVAQRLGSTLRGPGRLPPPFENDEIEIWGQTRDEWRRHVERA